VGKASRAKSKPGKRAGKAPSSKVHAKAVSKAAGGKSARPKAPPAKHPAKPGAKPSGKTAPAHSAPKPKPTAPAPAASQAPTDASKKPGPKGITIVSQKPMRKPRIKPKLVMPTSEPLLKPGGPKWKPLIPSGPKATPTGLVGASSHGDNAGARKPAIRLPKRELDKYRQILLQKRRELIGDVANMEDEALRQSSGALSHLPQHMAEQGTDAFDQAMSLDLAQVDRNLIREIDDALKRIEDGTYGICERSGVPIRPERLAELPWAKYTIEAARALERRPYQE
jgi:DnaK suppressor protein